MKILVICTGNSCRSQMAEGYLKFLFPNWEIYSAGTNPEKEVNPLAIKVMQEKGIDISNQKPEKVDKYINENFDYVFTVCDDAKEKCPVFTGKVKYRHHKGFEDPAKAIGTPEEVLNKYREVRDQIFEYFSNFFKQHKN